MFSNATSIAAAFSSSSLSMAASADTSTAAALLHLNTPRFVAKSPSLLKANQGAADATAIRGPVPPCAFTLRGKGRAREQSHGGSDNRPATTIAKLSPRRIIRVDTGEGYSPRLRMMSGERFTRGHSATTTTSAAVPHAAAPVEQASFVSPPQLPPSAAAAAAAAAAFAGLNDPTCGAEEQAVFHETVTSSSPRRDNDEAGERDPKPDAAPDVAESTAWGSQARAKATGPPQTRERPRTTSREGCLCGRLWVGTTAAPRSDAARPRILFLVSGQRQPRKKEEGARVKHRQMSRRRERSRGREAPLVVLLPPSVNARACTSERGKRMRSGGWRRGCLGSKGPKRVEGTGACRDGQESPRSPMGSDGRESCDVETTAATDGKGNDSARRVVHVRVPPTPLLVVRSALPAVEQT
ncbi:unnamed protein product [Scytosiphon promiscuus]